MTLSESTYYYFAVKMLMYILYFAGMLGLFQSAPEYTRYLHMGLTTFIGVYLMYIFNPISPQFERFGKLGQYVAFDAGFFLLASLFLQNILEMYHKITDKYNFYKFKKL